MGVGFRDAFWKRCSSSCVTDEDFWGMGKVFQEADSVSRAMEARCSKVSGCLSF